jgi:hypothetical protein
MNFRESLCKHAVGDNVAFVSLCSYSSINNSNIAALRPFQVTTTLRLLYIGLSRCFMPRGLSNMKVDKLQITLAAARNGYLPNAPFAPMACVIN